jgi:hypothetical protein
MPSKHKSDGRFSISHLHPEFSHQHAPEPIEVEDLPAGSMLYNNFGPKKFGWMVLGRLYDSFGSFAAFLLTRLLQGVLPFTHFQHPRPADPPSA